MAKMTTLAKIEKTVLDMAGTSTELRELDATLLEISDMGLTSVETRLKSAQKRAKEDYDYLANKIRGYVAREATLEKLIELAPRLFS